MVQLDNTFMFILKLVDSPQNLCILCLNLVNHFL